MMNNVKEIIVWQLDLVNTFLFLGGDKKKALKMVDDTCSEFGTESVFEVLNKETHSELFAILN